MLRIWHATALCLCPPDTAYVSSSTKTYRLRPASSCATRHEADTAADEALAGVDDPALLAAAVHDERALVTRDLDLADFRRYPPEMPAGIVVLRPHD